MSLLTSLNYFAMIVGYITIVIIILLVILFTGLILKEKYENWKWKKEREKRQKEQEQKKSAIQTEASKEAPNQENPEAPNVQISIKQ